MRPGAGRGDRQPGASSPEGGTTQPGWSGLGDQQGGGGLAEMSGRHRNRLAGCTQHPTVRPQPGSQASPPNLYLGLHSRTSGLSGQSQPREWRSAPASQGAGHVARGAKEAAGGSGGLLKERRGVPGREGGALGRQSERKAGGRGRGGGQGRHASGQAAPCTAPRGPRLQSRPHDAGSPCGVAPAPGERRQCAVSASWHLGPVTHLCEPSRQTAGNLDCPPRGRHRVAHSRPRTLRPIHPGSRSGGWVTGQAPPPKPAFVQSTQGLPTPECKALTLWGWAGGRAGRDRTACHQAGSPAGSRLPAAFAAECKDHDQDRSLSPGRLVLVNGTICMAGRCFPAGRLGPVQALGGCVQAAAGHQEPRCVADPDSAPTVCPESHCTP